MDVFLLSAGIGKQNAALQSGIELATAETNVLGFIRMVDTAYVCCMWMRFPASGGSVVKADEWHVDFCLGGSQKCLSAPASMAFLCEPPCVGDYRGGRICPYSAQLIKESNLSLFT